MELMTSASDRGRAYRTVVLTALVVGLVAAAAGGQQTKRIETGRVTADLIEYDFGKHAFTATGNTHVTIVGDHHAEVRAPALSMNVSEDMDQILVIEAQGPVNFEVVTAPDEDGTKRRIVASATRSATYRQAEQTVVLSGDACADVTTLPEGSADAAHFEGESIVVDLEGSTLSVRQATIEVTTEIEEDGEQ